MKMPSTPASSTFATAIKWTDEEWVRIAAHLYAIHGPDLLRSENLDEVKARDVFDAQAAVLPPERHRKLISLAQGFQAIRTRLRSILENQASSPVPHATSAAIPTEKKNTTRKQSRTGKPVGAQQALFSTDGPAAAGLKETAVFPAAANTEVAETTENQSDSESSSSDSDSDRIQAVVENRSDLADADLSGPLISPTAGAQGHEERKVRNDHAASRPVSKELSGERNVPRRTVAPAAGGLIEQMRPLIAMVCEELTQALVKTMSEKGNAELLSDFMQSVAARASSPTTMATRGAEFREARQPGQGKPGFQENDKAGVPSFTSRNIEEDGMAEEEDLHEPQPLFDPKLPPSAVSDFKPTIGLVGADAHQAIELQTQYPQLQLIVVPADAVKVGRPFQRCQRVIGMKDGVPAPVDEFLGRILRHRYVRISGGVGRVQEQLNAWLNGSAGFNMRSEKPGPRGNKGGRNLYANKRPNRFRAE